MNNIILKYYGVLKNLLTDRVFYIDLPVEMCQLPLKKINRTAEIDAEDDMTLYQRIRKTIFRILFKSNEKLQW